MCEVVKHEMREDERIVLDGAGTVVPGRCYIPSAESPPDEDGVVYPIGCRHPAGDGWTDWEPLPPPGDGEAVLVPAGSELALGIVAGGRFHRDFTEKQYDEWLEAGRPTATSP